MSDSSREKATHTMRPEAQLHPIANEDLIRARQDLRDLTHIIDRADQEILAVRSAATPIAPVDAKLAPATVRPADLPSGWSETVADVGDQSEATMEFCGVKLSTPVGLYAASFTSEDSPLPLFSYAFRFRRSEAQRLLGAVRSAMTKTCVRRLDSGLEDEPQISVSYRSRTVPRLADGSVGYRSAIGSFIDVKAIMFRKGDVLVTVAGSPVVDIDRIAAKIAVRI